MTRPDRITEEEAARLWRRAAELQAEAARRAESEALPPGAEEADDPGEGYALTHVRAAAIEAGIGEEFVEAALADLQSERVARAGAPPRRGLASLVLGSPPEALTVRRRIRAAPLEVLRAMEAVLPKDPYGLALVDRRGDPADGGALVFDIPGAGFTSGGQPGFVGDASWADMRQVHAWVQPVPGDEGVTDVTLRAPVAWAWRVNASIGSGFGVLGGGLGTALGSGAAALVAAATGGASIALAGLIVALGGAGGATGGVWVMRALYRSSLHRGEGALRNILSAVAAEAEGGWGLAPRELTGG